jgi:hypothetical protein
MLLIKAGLSEAEADAFLDRLRAEFAAGHLEEQEALQQLIQRELGEMKRNQRISPGWLGAIITSIISGVASNFLYDGLKSRFESGPTDGRTPTVNPSLPSGGYGSPDPDSHKVHILVINKFNRTAIKEARIELDFGVVDLHNNIVKIGNIGSPLKIGMISFPIIFFSGEDGTSTVAINPTVLWAEDKFSRLVVSASAPFFSIAHKALLYRGPPANKYRFGKEMVEIFDGKYHRHITFDESVVLELSPRIRH